MKRESEGLPLNKSCWRKETFFNKLERAKLTSNESVKASEHWSTANSAMPGELQSEVSVAQEALAKYRRLEPRYWIIRRDEVMISEKVKYRGLGKGISR